MTAFDIDGVVADVVTPFLRLLSDRHGYRGFTPDDVTDFDLEQTLGIPGNVVDDLLQDILERPVEIDTRPYPGAAETLEQLCHREPLLFVTSRSQAEPIREWFKAVLPGLPETRVEIIATGDPDLKLECLRDKNRSYFVDDHLGTCRLLDQAGLTAFVFDQPWNRQASDLPRIKGWTELGRLFGLT